MADTTKEVVTDLSPLIKVYKDGTIERLYASPIVPPSPNDPITGVSSKDITIISPQVSARLYLPKLDPNNNRQKLPIIVYFHAGGFCIESAFSFLDHCYMNLVSSEANAIVVSVDYRLAPEHPLPAGYEDGWTALQWVASQSHDVVDNTNFIDQKDPWLINHGNFDRIFVGGDSAGGNIAYNIAMRASTESLHGGVKIFGAILMYPFFWGSKPLSNSMSIEEHEKGFETRVWLFAYPSVPGGIDNPMINPLVDNAPDLARLGCSSLFICTAEKDVQRERAVNYVEAVKRSGWKGEVELVDVEGEEHCFQVFDPYSPRAKDLIKRMASFVMQ